MVYILQTLDGVVYGRFTNLPTAEFVKFQIESTDFIVQLEIIEDVTETKE